ncbi:MAG: cyclic-di-AMP receptor [Chloroflexota bacterium]|nr:cyclic-di-AMP receptor [Chloroflexota bacterium]
MKLIIAIVKDTDALAVTDALVDEGVGVTQVASTGGFLRHGNVTLLIGVEPVAVERVFEVIEESCHTPESGQHKATAFVLPAEKFTQLG